MSQSQLSFVPKYITNKAILSYLVVLAICFAIFSRKLPFLWMGFGIFEVAYFFIFLNILSRKWALISSVAFRRKIFISAFWIRAIYVVAIYFFYQLMNGSAFEFDAGDSIGYHGEAVWITDLFTSGKFSVYFGGYKYGISDTGFPLWLSLIYAFSFNSIIVARLINALLNAWMCVLLYKIGQRNFGEQAARITAIMAMLLPTFIFYTGLHLKETTMVFFLIAFAERIDYMLRSSVRKPWMLAQVVLLGTSLFFFRTVLAAAAWFALFSALAFMPNKIVDFNRRLTFLIWISIAVTFVLSGRILSEVSGYAEDRFTNQNLRMNDIATREGANKLAKYGSATIFLPLMVAAPFPTLVNVPTQRNFMMINGAYFIRNVYAFFVLVALVVMFRRKILQQSVFILAMLGSYIFILANSGFALSERFHLPLVPFLLLLAGYGVTVMDKKSVRYYIPYLIFIGLVIMGWNWFKLAGRGLMQ